jgi:hypothetical protein
MARPAALFEDTERLNRLRRRRRRPRADAEGQ